MISRSRQLLTSLRFAQRSVPICSLAQHTVVAMAGGIPVLVHERQARETLGGERGPPTANASAGGGDLTGVRVWEAASALINHLDTHREELLEGRVLLDVGAGTGAVGLAAAAFGAKHVVLSDVDSLATLSTDSGWQPRTSLAMLADNVALNGARADTVTVAELRWGCPAHIAALRETWKGFDTIVASDVLYYPPETYGALVDTIRGLAAPDATVIIAYVVRHGKEHTFVDLLTEATAEGVQFEHVVRRSTRRNAPSAPSHASRVVELRARESI